MSERRIKDRYGLLQRGLFPEVLPPCFTSVDLKRSLGGLVRTLKARAFFAKRQSDYIRYSGTKHDGSRRYYGTPNPISYFYVASFIAERWTEFADRFDASPFSVSRPKVGRDTDDRPVIMQSLSELTTIASKKLRYAEHILKTDISQFYPSVYTHTISWSAHGIDQAKSDTADQSQANYFNALDLFTRNCQLNESRGLLVGPDAFRLVAEYIMAGIDVDLKAALAPNIVGASRHVDDYYLGLSGEPEALAALSTLRDTLQRYSLHINDSKTRVMAGVEPLNDLWAQELRQTARGLGGWFASPKVEDLVLFINKALSIAKETKSDSAVKIALRTLDQIRAYDGPHWEVLEPYIQRIIFHHPHAIDYAALLVVKRVAEGREIDREGWKEACYTLLRRHLAYNHHHEIVWLLWLLISANLEVSDQLTAECCNNRNAHIRAMIIAAYQDKLLQRRPAIRLGAKLASTTDDWLVNLVGKARGFSGAAFSGALAEEFEHLAGKKVRLIDFKAHIKAMKVRGSDAISRTRYGYDSEKKTRVGQEFSSFDFDDDGEEDGGDILADDDLDEQMAEAVRRDNT